MQYTSTTEAKLAREKGLCYQPIVIPYNWASGINHIIEMEQSLELGRRMKDYLIDLMAALPAFIDWDDCSNCWQSMM